MNNINTTVIQLKCSPDNIATMEIVYNKLSLLLLDMYSENVAPNRGYLLNAHASDTTLELVGDSLPSDFYFKSTVTIINSPSDSENNIIKITYNERGIGNHVLQNMLRVIENYEL